MPIITLLTDFGNVDEYVGVMKGVIFSIAPGVTIVDLSHEIAPQNIFQAALMLKSAYSFFPNGSIHVIVVDPGVGGGRRIIAASCHQHIFIAPDNGVLTEILEAGSMDEAFIVNNEKLCLAPISRTFHGRDIFAPVAAHLANGIKLEQLGPALNPDSVQKLAPRRPTIDANGVISGEVVAIDRFGNLITSIPETLLSAALPHQALVRIGDQLIRGIASSYAAVENNSPLAIIGSRGYLEISVSGGNAQSCFKLDAGSPITIFNNP